MHRVCAKVSRYVAVWREGCAVLQAMGPGEYHRGEIERYREFRQIDKRLTWELVGPHFQSLFSVLLDGPPDPWASPG